jgi:hypothetical protein
MYVQKLLFLFQYHVTLVMQLIFGQVRCYAVNSECIAQVMCSSGSISLIAHFLKAYDFIITWEYNSGSMWLSVFVRCNLFLIRWQREVNTSELMMIDRMFVAEEHGLLERLKEEERRAKGKFRRVTNFISRVRVRDGSCLCCKMEHYCVL